MFLLNFAIFLHRIWKTAQKQSLKYVCFWILLGSFCLYHLSWLKIKIWQIVKKQMFRINSFGKKCFTYTIPNFNTQWRYTCYKWTNLMHIAQLLVAGHQLFMLCKSVSFFAIRVWPWIMWNNVRLLNLFLFRCLRRRFKDLGVLRWSC